MTVVNELKSGNVLTKALSPAKTMARAKFRGASKSNVPNEDETKSSTDPQTNIGYRHKEHR